MYPETLFWTDLGPRRKNPLPDQQTMERQHAMGHSEYENSYSTAPDYFGQEPSRWVDKYIPEGGKLRILDVGSGQGRNALHLARQGHQVTAVDSSRTATRALYETAENEGLPIQVACKDISQYPLNGQSYDVVLTISVLCHLDPGVIEEVAARMTEALCPGGLLVAEEFTPDDPGARDGETASEFAPLVKNYFSPENLKQLFSPLDPVHCQTHSVTDTTHGEQHKHSLIRYVGRR